MKFIDLEVRGVRDDGTQCEVVEDELADFFSIYGRDEHGFAHCIGDFTTREDAESIRAAIESGIQSR